MDTQFFCLWNKRCKKLTPFLFTVLIPFILFFFFFALISSCAIVINFYHFTSELVLSFFLPAYFFFIFYAFFPFIFFTSLIFSSPIPLLSCCLLLFSSVYYNISWNCISTPDIKRLLLEIQLSSNLPYQSQYQFQYHCRHQQRRGLKKSISFSKLEIISVLFLFSVRFQC